MDKKIYIPKSGCKKVEFSNGGHLYRFSFHAETFQQFLAEQMRDGEFVNKGGYIAINISERREPSEWGTPTTPHWIPLSLSLRQRALRTLQRSSQPRTFHFETGAQATVGGLLGRRAQV